MNCDPSVVGYILVAMILPTVSAQEAGSLATIPNSANASVQRIENELHFRLEKPVFEAEIRLPRLNNNVCRAYLKTKQDAGNQDAGNQDAENRETLPLVSGSEYLAPRLPDPTQELPFSQTPSEWRIALPDTMAFPATVILQLTSPAVYAPNGQTCTADPDGTLVLPARHGRVFGEKLQFEPVLHKNTVGYWIHPEDYVTWQFKTTGHRQWEVHILQGCGSGQGGSLIELDFGSKRLKHRVIETGHFQNFRWKHVGRVELPTGKEISLKVSCKELAKKAVMDIRQIRLVPTGTSPLIPQRLSHSSPDCDPPAISVGPARPGKRVITSLADASPETYHSIYLPTNWNKSMKFPVLVEWGGNGPYQSPLGDRNSGRVEDGVLGFGLGGNDGYIWICLPYLNDEGTRNVSQWWGTPPKYTPDATLKYAQKAIRDVCERFNGDPDRLVLIGFSRGAIACNHLGLYNEEMAKLWKGFVCFSHYDGVRKWPMPSSTTEAARQRLKRLGSRPQWILSESRNGKKGQLAGTMNFLANEPNGTFHFMETGYINHDDDWALRPGPTRQAVRAGLQRLLDLDERQESL